MDSDDAFEPEPDSDDCLETQSFPCRRPEPMTPNQMRSWKWLTSQLNPCTDIVEETPLVFDTQEELESLCNAASSMILMAHRFRILIEST